MPGHRAEKAFAYCARRDASGNFLPIRSFWHTKASKRRLYPTVPDAEPPKFKDCAKHPKADEDGFVLYYTDQCPFTCYWVPRVQETAKEHGIPLKVIHITDKEAAQSVPAPVTTYALFRNGRFLTQGIQSDKKFLALAGISD